MDFAESEVYVLSEQLDEPEWLLQERLQAFHAFQKLINDPKLKEKPKLPDLLSKPKIEIKKQKGMHIEKLHNMLNSTQAEFAKDIFLNRNGKSQNWRIALINAFFTECNIYIVENAQAELELESSGGPALNFVIIKEGSSLAYVHLVQAEGFQSVETIAGQNAKLSRLLVQHAKYSGFFSNVFLLERGSHMEHASFIRGGGNLEIQSLLVGEQSEVHDVVVFTENDSNSLQLYSLLNQIATNTKGNILIKGIAQETAQAKLDGMIHIGKQASNSNSFLDQHVMLLNPGARADTNPQLEIENNNVQSSHSASVGQISEDKLFYLESRGISSSEARKLLVEGFLGSAVEKIRTESHREIVATMLAQFF